MANEENKSVKTMVALVVIAIIVVAVALFFYTRSSDKEVPVSEPITTTPPMTAPVPEPETPKPVYDAPEPEPQETPLPALSDSDESVKETANELSDNVTDLIVPDEILRKLVRAVSAVEEGKIVHEYRPLVSPAPPFKVERVVTDAEQPRQYKLSEENYHRYDKYVDAFVAMDADELAKNYKRYYPLLEDAFREMGSKKGNFQTVMLNAIDNVLATPAVDGEILLVRPKVFYQYADPALEKLPASQKLLIRMGPENARKVKAHLKELRANLAQ